MRSYKPEGATHYSATQGFWYKRLESGIWLFWWSAKAQWSKSTYTDETAKLVLRPIVSDTGANQ